MILEPGRTIFGLVDHVTKTRGLESWIDVVYVICYTIRKGTRDTAFAHAAKRLFKSRFDIFRSLTWLDQSQITAKPMHHAMDVVFRQLCELLHHWCANTRNTYRSRRNRGSSSYLCSNSLHNGVICLDSGSLRLQILVHSTLMLQDFIPRVPLLCDERSVQLRPAQILTDHILTEILNTVFISKSSALHLVGCAVSDAECA